MAILYRGILKQRVGPARGTARHEGRGLAEHAILLIAQEVGIDLAIRIVVVAPDDAPLRIVDWIDPLKRDTACGRLDNGSRNSGCEVTTHAGTKRNRHTTTQIGVLLIVPGEGSEREPRDCVRDRR